MKKGNALAEFMRSGSYSSQQTSGENSSGPNRSGSSILSRSSNHQKQLQSINLASDISKPTNTSNKVKQFIIISLFVIGIIVCITSLLCILLLPSFVTQQISKRLVLKNNSLLLERWSKPNVPMFFKVWVWNVENAQEIIDKRGTKPELKEIGPFVFNLKRQKDVVSFAGDNLYYTERKLYHFNPELSCCSINTTVTIPNIPLIAVVDRALSYNLPLVGRFIPRLINRAIQSLREQLFVRKQAREILFDGYEVDLLKMVSRVGSLVGLPQTQQKFALLKGRNDTWRPEQDGVWAINTGAKDRRMFGKVSSWNSYRQLPFWAASGCNTINGSDGTLFPPPIKQNEPLYIFNQELCRTVNLVFDRPSDIRSIKAFRFVLNPLNFAHTMAPGTGVTPRPQGLFRPSVQTPADNNNKLKPDSTQATSTSQRVANSLDAELPNKKLKSAASETVASMALPNSGALPNSLLANKRQEWSMQASNKPRDPSQPATPAEQQRLVQVAQENSAQLERQSESRRNPFTCFCDRKSTNLNGVNVCEFDGLIELSKCTKQAQVIFGSMPHFFQSDPRLSRQVSGMQPNASRHTTYLDIEPNTGLVLGGKRRVQLNIIIKHNNEVDGFENINDMLVPVVWFEESAMIPEEAASKFKSLYTDRIRMVNLVLTSLFLAALGLLAIDVRLLATHYGHCYRRFKLAPATNGIVISTSSMPSTKTTQLDRQDSDSSTGSEHSSDHKIQSHKGQVNGVTAKLFHPTNNYIDHTNLNGMESPLLGRQSSIGNLVAGSQNKSVEFAVRSNDTLEFENNKLHNVETNGASRSIINFENGWRQHQTQQVNRNVVSSSAIEQETTSENGR